MKVEHVNAYISATKHLFDVMFSINHFERKILATNTEPEGQYEVSAVIGVTGAYSGIVVLSFTQAVAIKMVSQLAEENISTLDEDACDALGEMVNIIAGNANRELEKRGVGKLTISVPTVLVGKEHRVNNPKNVPYVCIGFETDLGQFAIHVSLDGA